MNPLEATLARIRSQMDLDAESEHEILTEIRDHLEEAIAEAQAQGLDATRALARAATHFGLEEEIGRELQSTHAGWGTADAIIAAALPVISVLVLRWLIFAPDGSALGWAQLLNRPSFWVVALGTLLIPILKFERWHHALATWLLFWALTVVVATGSAVRW